jgi:microcystin degradation protein MlrC
MMAEILAQEKNFAEKMVSPEDGVEQAMRLASNASRAIVIADTQDNPGCGGSADSTGVLKALVAAQAQEVVLGFMCDAQAAAAAHAAGEGSKVTLKLGGHSGPVGVTPFEATFSVDKLGNGKMKTDGAVSGGREIDVGPMALLRVDGIRIVVTSKRFQALDQAPFRHLGIEPAEQKILVLKSTCHYRAEFEPLAEHIIVVLAPGYYLADPTDYPFKKLREGVRLKPLGEVFSAQHATNG